MEQSTPLRFYTFRYGPDTFVLVISQNYRFYHILINELALKLDLIRKTATNPIRFNLVALAVDADIQRLALTLVAKGSDDRNNLYRQIVM